MLLLMRAFLDLLLLLKYVSQSMYSIYDEIKDAATHM